MKNSIFKVAFIALFAMLALGCENNEVAEVQTQKVNQTKLHETIKKLASNQEFRDLISSRMALRANGDNGTIILQDQYGVYFGRFLDGNLCLIGGDGNITALPDGRARFSVHTNQPSADVISFPSFETLYTSQCVTGPLGFFNYNYISEYEVIEIELGPGFIITFYSTTDVNASALTVNGQCRVSDAMPVYDENFEFVDCGVGTVTKTMKIKQNGNFTLQ